MALTPEEHGEASKRLLLTKKLMTNDTNSIESKGTELEQLNYLIEFIKSNLVHEQPIFISKDIATICRAGVFREAVLWRIAELSESAYDAFSKNRLVTAFIMCRSIMETESLFWKFVDLTTNAINSKNIEEVKQFLDRAMAGAIYKTAKAAGRPNNPFRVWEIVRDFMGKEISHYWDHYESLSEFTHPNAPGVIDSYVVFNWETLTATFGINVDKLGAFPSLTLLIGSIRAFILKYDHSAELLTKLTPICELLLETQQPN